MEISDLLNMLKNPQAIQAKANELKQKTAAIRAIGQSGGGMVKVTLTGEMEMLECSIAPEVVDPTDSKMLEDLIRAAHHDAAERVQEAIRQQLTESMGGMAMPPGLFGGGNPFGGL
ncbi:MAG: YbaB/EbfC family nucleoid-associated protein [Spirochaetales bacterium]